MNRKLEKRNVIITGGGQGLGLAIATAYVRAGASLLICCRDRDSIEKARALLASVAHPTQKIIALAADVADKDDVDRIVETAVREFSQIQVLVNNAGIYGPKGPIEKTNWSDWVRTVEINLFGSVLMCRAVLPHMKSTGYGKIIQLSGGGATKPLPLISAYAATKAAVVRFVETLAEEVRDWGIDVNSLAPGALNTRLLDEILEAGPEQVGAAFYAQALKQQQSGGTPLENGAALAVFLASAESDGITGKLISAVWDPWQTFPRRITDLRGTDVYTLRRIGPEECRLNWDTDKVQ